VSADRELLELAAKAAGIGGRWDQFRKQYRLPLGMFLGDEWNPLQNHKQAIKLRHAAKLTTGYDDRFAELGPCAYATYQVGEHGCNSVMQNIEQAGGKRAALRLAIVIAAAEVGRAL
jgi:hypothetical protein